MQTQLDCAWPQNLSSASAAIISTKRELKNAGNPWAGAALCASILLHAASLRGSAKLRTAILQYHQETAFMTKKCTDARRVTASLGIAFLSCLCTFSVRASAGTAPAPADEALLQSTLESALTTYNLPAIAGAIITSDHITTFDTGIRRVGGSASVEKSDLWNLGSCTKSMTATMIAVLVERGLLRWDSTIQEVLPDLTPDIRADYLSVTVEDLLHHRSGLPAFEDANSVAALLAHVQQTDTLTRQRLEGSRYVLSVPPATTPGVGFLYTDVDYMVAAAMAERVTGKSYESLMDELLFDRLGIRQKWGLPAAGGAAEPWGHTVVAGQNVPADPASYQFPAFLNSAGNVSLSIRAWARFVQLHLRGLQGEPRLLQADTFQRLHTPVFNPGDPYPYSDGWVEIPVNGVPTSWHNGTTGTFYATMFIQPTRNLAAIVVTNVYNSSDPAFTSYIDFTGLQLLGY